MRALALVAVVAVVAVVAGCGGRPVPGPPPPPVVPAHVAAAPDARAAIPARTDFDAGASPMGVVVAGDHLVWTDAAGAIWTLAMDGGGPPRQLSEQHGVGFGFHAIVAGGQVLVTAHKDLFHVALPDGPVTKLGVTGLLEDPEEAVADDAFVYVTLFRRDEVMKIPVRGGAAQKLFDFRRGVLALHGATLYAVSYTTGVLVSAPTAGGKPTVIAKGIPRPTALAADDRHAYVYSEKDQTVRRIELATGRAITLASGLSNSDRLVLDGPWLYTVSWGKRPSLVRIPIAGGPEQVLADDLASPSSIAIDAEAVYVTSRDQGKIVRLRK